jgi:LacI family transcriptional regulator
MCPSSPRAEKKVTLGDIALASGVSTATVSLVLRDKPGVSEETRQRVLDTARTLGYTYSPSNQAVGRVIPNRVGVIMKSRPNDLPSTNSFYAPVLAGIEAVCRRNQINLLYANLPVDEMSVPLETPRLMLDGEVDGLLIVGMHLDETMVGQLTRNGRALVLVDAYAAGDAFDAVVSDNFAGAYRATRFLIENGHRNIAIVGSQQDAYPSILERRTGFLQALADHSLTPYFADCVLHPSVVDPYVRELLARSPEVTAIFGANDDVAIASMRTAQDLGRRVPEDLSVTGYDNIAMSHMIRPRLTTMSIDIMGMGRLAAQMLLNRIEYPEAGRVRTVVCPDLVVRESVVSH